MTGASRFLNKIYANDIDISGTSSFAGLTTTGLTVNGNASVTGTLTLTKTTDAATGTSNSPALIIGGTASTAHIEIDNNEIIAKSNGTTATILYLNPDGGTVHLSNQNKIYANNGTLTATNITSSGTSTLTTVIGTDGKFNNVTVTDTLKSFKWDIDHVANLGGNFMVTPTYYANNGATFYVSTISGTTITAKINDGTAISGSTMGGITWAENSKIKISGKIGNITLDACDGKLTNVLNNDNGTMDI